MTKYLSTHNIRTCTQCATKHVHVRPITIRLQAKITEKRMRPWVSKKITEYLGEEEKTLIDFIMNKITAHTPPEEMLSALSPILDEEAPIFVVKMWRMLVYEMFTAAKASA